MLGGLAPVGVRSAVPPFREFDPVSIKMAKEQNLSLNNEDFGDLWPLNVLPQV